MLSDGIAISVKGLGKRFDEKWVVDGVDLEVPAGSVFGFLGPNGSGKTTCIRMICGLLEPSSGSGRCLEFDILKQRERIKREVGYMTQRFALYEDLTVRENLLFVARAYEVDTPRLVADEVMEKFGLADRRNQLAGALSGGWKQRLSLAAAMLHEPRLLLLDEPTAGVDPKARRDFWSEIHELSRAGLTVLVTTHYMDEAERCSDLAYIANGKILTRGKPGFLTRESGLSTFRVHGEKLFELANRLRQFDGVEQVAAFGTELHVSGPDAALLTRALEANCGPGARYEPQETLLEDVFIHLMERARR
ncbi:ABC transporter, ATP-binding protein [Verrucomicrobiia bacterium DG1235]|nr:ABC transporter, ATP-binding protein [Verrucomicrobiae bacterium DG1235]